MMQAVLEDGKVTISRLKSKVDYPAKFFPVFAIAPCPCGYYGEGDRCTCTPSQRALFLSKLGGPIYDRLTMQILVHPEPTPGEVKETKENGESATVVAARVAKARAIQMKRQKKLNDELSISTLDAIAKLDDDCREFLEKLIERLDLSIRAYTKMLRIARTIADLDGVEDILPHHIAEASSYRFLDRREF